MSQMCFFNAVCENKILGKISRFTVWTIPEKKYLGGGRRRQTIYFSMGGWRIHFSNYMGHWCLKKSDYMGGGVLSENGY